MQSYIERSRQIRNLSMPPENKEHFYGQFRVNFLQIRELYAENRAYLNDEVFTPLKDRRRNCWNFPTIWPILKRWKWWMCGWRFSS